MVKWCRGIPVKMDGTKTDDNFDITSQANRQNTPGPLLLLDPMHNNFYQLLPAMEQGGWLEYPYVYTSSLSFSNAHITNLDCKMLPCMDDCCLEINKFD